MKSDWWLVAMCDIQHCSLLTSNAESQQTELLYRHWRTTHLIQNEPAGLPFGAVSGSLVQVPRQRMVVVGPLGEVQQLILIYANSSLHFRAQHFDNFKNFSLIIIQHL
jgi:hypothetical protein